MRFRNCRPFTALIFVMLIVPAAVPATDNAYSPETSGVRRLEGIFVFDGYGIHNVGQLQMHTGNWGIFGSYPGSNWPTSAYPSAVWPANSGVEHLYIAGLWVGAIRNGIPRVSTSAYEIELRPTDDVTDRIYRAHEGAPGGYRLPSPHADDDNDGLTDEDWLNGRDDDADGLIDEDFAAISDQMFSSWFTDDQPDATRMYPQHVPLHILVRQESYQWRDERFDDFVGATFTITNLGVDPLEDVYLGLFVDGDVGPRSVDQYELDDASGAWFGTRCTDLGPVSLNMGYVYDADGDSGQTPGYFGVMILGHPVDPLGDYAPSDVGMTSFQIFSGDQPYENGGDPVNDFQRYELMSKRQFDRNKENPRDYRMLLSTGPFAEIGPDQSIVFSVGFVVGEGMEGLLDNAAYCQRLYDGLWFDVDGNPLTGTRGREMPLYGPVSGVDPDLCDDDPTRWSVPRGEILWINHDCEREDYFRQYCMYGDADSLIFRTGVAGRETQVHWIYEVAPVPLTALDIRPGSCPNPFNIKLFDFLGCRKDKKGGVLPVAILGSEGFDVGRIDVSTVRLEGVAPLPRGQGYDDVSGPVGERTGCECTTEGPDGFIDLTLKFSNQAIAAALLDGCVPVPGESRMLVITGELDGGSSFWAGDCIRFVGKPPLPDHTDRPRLLDAATSLLVPYPNPFNPATVVEYVLEAAGHVSIDVYDAGGRHVKRLVDGNMTAGRHTAVWEGRDDAGAVAASGVYFFRMESARGTTVRKAVLLR